MARYVSHRCLYCEERGYTEEYANLRHGFCSEDCFRRWTKDRIWLLQDQVRRLTEARDTPTRLAVIETDIHGLTDDLSDVRYVILDMTHRLIVFKTDLARAQKTVFWLLTCMTVVVLYLVLTKQ